MSERSLGFFERYLTLWVALCMILALALGHLFPGLTDTFEAFQIAGYSVPVVVVLFLMIYPIMVQTPFQEIIRAGKTIKPIVTTLSLNWAVKPFLKAFLAWVFFTIIWASFLTDAQMVSELMGGMILLGLAPCTAMVLVWSYLSKGNMGHTIVTTAINSLSMLILYAPLVILLLPVADIPGAEIIIPFSQVAFGVFTYIGLPMLAGYLTRKILLDRKGVDWFEGFVKKLHFVSIAALLVTIVVIVSPHSGTILSQPLIVFFIAVPLLVQFFIMFALSYWTAKKIGLKYEDAAPTAQIATSNHFEVAIAMSVTIFGIESYATLAAVTGLLIEVPVMLVIVQVCLRTRHWFDDGR